ncbi:MAG: CDP-alcohol phosphatidyltransferase family protein [Actinomycetota bacterium]|nr:CDP-alcohol phosphatidyltransferase family protein [Actinomycetota bacterium]
MAADGEARILTVPNFLSLFRLCCIPVFVWLLLGRENRLAAAALLGVLGATDWVDGYVARRFNQVSTVGKVLDPTADRALLLVGIVAILIDGSVPAWIAWLAIAREAVVAIGTMTLLALGGRRIDVQFTGKVGTFLLMMTFPLFLASNDAQFGGADVVGAIAWPCAIVGLSFAWYSAVTYVPVARKALQEGRSGRRSGASETVD